MPKPHLRRARIAAALSVFVALSGIVAAHVDWELHIFFNLFAFHNLTLLGWILAAFASLYFSAFRSWPYYMLLVLAPVAIWPQEALWFLLFRVFNARFAPCCTLAPNQALERTDSAE